MNSFTHLVQWVWTEQPLNSGHCCGCFQECQVSSQMWSLPHKNIQAVFSYTLHASVLSLVKNDDIKRRLLLGRKVMTNLDSILKSRDITSPTKVCLPKSMTFPVVMYGCESWTIKKAECQRSDVFELWCWEDSWESLGLQGDPTSPS